MHSYALIFVIACVLNLLKVTGTGMNIHFFLFMFLSKCNLRQVLRASHAQQKVKSSFFSLSLTQALGKID